MDYITIKEASAKWDIGVRRVTVLCNQDRIQGAVKKGIWLIPKDTERPVDPRISENKG